MMDATYIMKRTQIYLDANQDRRLSVRALSTGTTKSMLIREAVEAYLSTPDAEQARLASFRSALDALEKAPLDMPDGGTYVEELRRADAQRDVELERRRRP
jgi:predicted DNA-binding protein